jgi:hypothetical protein
MKQTLLKLLVFLCLVSKGLWAQMDTDTLLLLNGEEIITTVMDTAKGFTRCKNLSGSNKLFMIEDNRIFSVRNQKGERVYYQYDSAIGNEFSEQEMRYFIMGEQDAQKGFKAKGSFYGNMAVGVASGITGFFLCLIPPFIYTALTGLPNVRIKKKTVRDLELLKQETYLMGYERVARGKRKIRSLVGGGIGLVVGYSSYLIMKQNNAEILK